MIKSFLFSLTLLVLLQYQVFSQIRIEPPFWYAGMKNSSLQLLINGPEIGKTLPSIGYEGVLVKAVNYAESPNYIFLDLELSSTVQPGTFEIRFSQNGKNVHTVKYELRARKPGSADRKGFTSADVMYLLMPDRFANGDPSNDNVEGMLEKADRTDLNGRQGGDLKGISRHMDYIRDLGFTSVWINPVQENNQARYSYHGYAISDFYKIDPRFGSNQDYVNLVDEFHSKGIKVVMDLIMNHCGSGHWWMKDLPFRDWVHQWPEFTRSNFRTSILLDPYRSGTDEKYLLQGWFDVNMPDLNQKNPFMAKYLIQNSIWWVEYSGLDGIRMDTYPYSYKDFMADWSQAIMTEYPNFNIVGEAWLTDPVSVSYWQKGAMTTPIYHSTLPCVMDFPMSESFNFVFKENDGWNTGILRLYDNLAHDFVYPDPNNVMTFIDNHDCSRMFTKVGEKIENYKLALAFLLTTRGIPQVYYGTEILMAGHESAGHGGIRRPFPGGWPGDERNAFLENGRTNAENDAFQFLHNLINWRKNIEVIHTGKLMHFLPENGVYVFFRYNEKESVMVIMNNSLGARKLDTERFSERLQGFKSGYDVISRKPVNNLRTIDIQAKTAMVIELK